MSESNKDISVIPKGIYCYDENGHCPYHSIDKTRPNQENGYCSFLGYGDWEVDLPPGWPEEVKSAASLIWDSCKECGINDDIEEFRPTADNLPEVQEVPLQLKPEFVVEAAWFDNITDQWIQMVATAMARHQEVVLAENVNEYLDMTIQEGINRAAERLAFDHLLPPNFDVRANQGDENTVETSFRLPPYYAYCGVESTCIPSHAIDTA
jgi:hypothetical protein